MNWVGSCVKKLLCCLWGVRDLQERTGRVARLFMSEVFSSF
jgi:hypothetical protein